MRSRARVRSIQAPWRLTRASQDCSRMSMAWVTWCHRGHLNLMNKTAQMNQVRSLTCSTPVTQTRNNIRKNRWFLDQLQMPHTWTSWQVSRQSHQPSSSSSIWHSKLATTTCRLLQQNDRQTQAMGWEARRSMARVWWCKTLLAVVWPQQTLRPSTTRPITVSIAQRDQTSSTPSSRVDLLAWRKARWPPTPTPEVRVWPPCKMVLTLKTISSSRQLV